MVHLETKENHNSLRIFSNFRVIESKPEKEPEKQVFLFKKTHTLRVDPTYDSKVHPLNTK